VVPHSWLGQDELPFVRQYLGTSAYSYQDDGRDDRDGFLRTRYPQCSQMVLTGSESSMLWLYQKVEVGPGVSI